MSWLNLLTPSAAVIAIFLAIAVVVQSFRHGRAIRRIEQQIASAGIAAYDPTLDRLKALSGLSESGAADSRTKRLLSSRNLIIAGVVVLVLIVAGGAWALLRQGGSTATSTTASSKTTTHATTTQPSTSTATTTTTTTPAVTAVCATATPIATPSAVTVSLYNGSGVAGAAGKVLSPKLSAVGYAVGTVADAPGGVTDARTSKVEYVSKSDINAACSVATALGIPTTHVVPLTLLTATQAGTANVVVLIGTDIAS